MDIFADYTAFMNQVTIWFGASHSMMHVHAGLAIYVVAQLVIRTRRASMTALNTVIAAAVGHEVLDYLGSPAWDALDTLKDIGLTVMWPVAVTAIGQYRRARWKSERDLAQLYSRSGRGGHRPVPIRGTLAPLTRETIEPAE